MLLFNTEAEESGFAADTTNKQFGYKEFVLKFKEAVQDALSPDRYQTFFIKLEDQAIKSSRTLAGSIEGYSEKLKSTMFDVYKETIIIGGKTKDVIDFTEQYAETTGRVPPVIKETVVDAIKLSKEFGISTKEIANMVGGFAQLGLSQEFAINMVKKIGVEARKNMVNVDKLTKKVQENLKKSSAYTFKDGVKGLTEMAAKAERLGVKMESAFSLFDKFMDPDKAVEFASEMSMLGGQFAAQFGDPFSNMGADVEELREKLTKAASASAVFNEKTGEFDIPRAGLQALRVFAEQSGESVEDLASVAKQSAKEMRIMNEVGFQPDVSDEDRKLLSSMAEQKDGRWQVQLPGTDDWVDVANINADNMKNFQDAAQNIMSDKSPEQMNEKLLSIAERQNAALQQIRDAVVLRQGLDAGMTVAKIAESVTDAALIAAEKIADKFPADLMRSTLTTLQDSFTKYVDVDFEGDIGAIISFLETIATNSSAWPKPNPDVPTEYDAFSSPVKGGNFVSGPKGSFLTIPDDEILAAPNISKFVDAALTSFNSLNDINNSVSLKPTERTATLQNKMESPATKLQEIITTSNNNVNVSGGANVSGSVDVKVSGNGVNMDDPKLSALIMSKVSEMMEQRLSKGWKQKQGNIAS